jgi:hypothetical protein
MWFDACPTARRYRPSGSTLKPRGLSSVGTLPAGASAPVSAPILNERHDHARDRRPLNHVYRAGRVVEVRDIDFAAVGIGDVYDRGHVCFRPG